MHTNNLPDLDDSVPGNLRPPFTKATLRSDIVTVLLTEARRVDFLFNRFDDNSLAPLSRLLGLEAQCLSDDFRSPDVNWEQLGLQYEMVHATALAVGLEAMYDLAFSAEVELSFDAPGSGWGPFWFSRILTDLSNSPLVTDLEECAFSREAIGRCIRVCDTAQARLILEESEGFFVDWSGISSVGISIRQLSLLSGMTEASLRTLANPKRKNYLKTQSDGKNTFVVPAVAKAWLISKDRYIPLSRAIRNPEEDLTKRSFSTIAALRSALEQRVTVLLRGPDGDQVSAALREICADLVNEQSSGLVSLGITDAMLADTATMTRIGNALSLRGELVALRGVEALAADQLNFVRAQLAAAGLPQLSS